MSADGAPPAPARTSAPAVWLWDPHRRRALWANDAALDLFGARAAEALADRTSTIEAAIRGLGAGRRVAPATLWLGGSPVTGRLAAVTAALPDGRLGLRVEFAPDPRIVDEAARRAAAFDALPVAAAVVDGAGRVSVANPAFAAAFGVSAGRIDPATLAAGATTARRADGGLARLRAAAFVDPGEGGDLHAVVEADAAQSSAEGSVSPAALARVAHEFRSPLTAVLGFAEFLREQIDTTSPERARAYLDDLSTAAARVRRLADDLVAIGAAGARLRIDVAALDEIAAAALSLVGPAAAARGVRLGPAPQSGLEALVDAEALGRALLNLADNAVRHGQAGGAVGIAVEPGAEGAVALTVSDDGPGLDAAALDAALRPYGGGGQRAGGLGLAIVREIAEAHGGRLEIETAPGAGFTARIALPAACAVRRRRPAAR